MDLSLILSSGSKATEKFTGGRWINRWRPCDWRTGPSGLSCVVQPPGSSHRCPGPSHWRPGSSVWSPRQSVGPPEWGVISRSRSSWLCSWPGLGIGNSHTLVHPSLQQSPHGHKINQRSLVDSCWHWREKRTADTRQNGWVLSCRWRIPCLSSMGCWAVQCQGLKVCWAGHTCRVVILECWAVRCWWLTCWVGNFLWTIHHDWLVISSWPVACRLVICWAVTCRVFTCRAVTCRAVICWTVHNLWRTRHSCWVVHFSRRFFYVIWPGRRRDHCYGSLLWWLGNGQGQCTSRLETYDEPDVSALSRLLSWWWPGGDLRSADALDADEDRDLRSPEDLRWWWWAWEEEAEDRASVALETRLDPEPPVESVCLLELDPPEDVGRDHSPSRRPLSCLEAWCLGESWRLSDPCDLLLRSPLRDLWRSDPLELGRPTRYAGSHGLLGFTGPGRPDGTFLHLRSLRPRTCGCLGSFRLGRPFTGTLGRKLKDLFWSMYLNWVVHRLTLLALLCRFRRLTSSLLFFGFSLRLPCLWQPILTDLTGRIFCTQSEPLV